MSAHEMEHRGGERSWPIGIVVRVLDSTVVGSIQTLGIVRC